MKRREFLKRLALIGTGVGIAGVSPSLAMAATKKNSGELSPGKRRIRQDKGWDVIVIGGGPAGCSAAISAAREGARTLLIEAMGALGGTGTLGLIPVWCPFSDGKKIIYRGLAEKIFTESKRGVPHISPTRLDWVPINAEYLKRTYDNFVTDSGAQVLFFSRVAEVVMDSRDRIDSIVVANKAGLTSYKAKVYIDCTGDGDVAAWAGAEFHKGDEDGVMQSGTLCFMMDNVDPQGYKTSFKPSLSEMNKVWSKVLATGKYPLIDGHLNNVFVTETTVQFNASHVHGVDPTDPVNMSAAVLQGRRIAEEVSRALKENFPEAFAGSTLINTGGLMGIREGRRIVGDYTLTVDDWQARRSFEDEIGRNCYYLDVHKKGHKSTRYQKGESHGLPYRMLTPKGIANLLTAGRCMSTDHWVYGSVRVMPNCLVTGEAAGMAAAFAQKMSRPDVHSIDVARLRTRLMEEGQYFI